MVETNPDILVIMLSTNGLNALVKKKINWEQKVYMFIRNVFKIHGYRKCWKPLDGRKTCY